MKTSVLLLPLLGILLSLASNTDCAVHSFVKKFNNTFTLEENGEVQFYCYPDTNLQKLKEIKWYHNGTIQIDANNDKRVIQKKSTLRIKKLVTSDSGNYSCSDGENALAIYKLSVVPPITEYNDQPKQTRKRKQEINRLPPKSSAPRLLERLESDEPQTIIKTSGRSVRMNCRFECDPECQYEWKINGKEIERFNSEYMEMNSTSLYMENLSPSDSASYTCSAKNKYGRANFTYDLHVQTFIPSPPIINSTQLRNMHVKLGDSITWICSSFSDLEKVTQWFRFVVINETTTLKERIVDYGENLTINNISEEDFGTYGCEVTNSEGRTAMNVTLQLDASEQLPIMIKLHEGRTLRIYIFTALLCIMLLGVTICALRRQRQKITMVRAQTSIVVKRVVVEPNSIEKLLPIIKIEQESIRVPTKIASKTMNEYQFPLDTEWEVPRECLDIECEPLGEGAFGIVYKADAIGLIPNTHKIEVAVKMLKEGYSESDLKDLVTEMEVMKKVQGGQRHKNIINLLGCVTRNGPLTLVMEYAPNGNLRDFLRKRRHSWGYEVAIGEKPDPMVMTIKKLINFGYQIAQGMEFLSSKKCIHRDLAARNILVTEDETLKIADFGLARDIHDNEYYRKTTTGKLPIMWMAPETIAMAKYTMASDVWSFGITLWEIMTLGETPYSSIRSGHDPVTILLSFLEGGRRLEKPKNCPNEVYQLMLKTWDMIPDHRPTFRQLVKTLEKMLSDGYIDLNYVAPVECRDKELFELEKDLESLKSEFALYENQQPYSNHFHQQMEHMNPTYFSNVKYLHQNFYDAREDTV